MEKITLNDKNRSQWIDNDEGLYNWWKSSHISKSKFIQENRKELTQLIMAQLDKKPAEKTWRDYAANHRSPFGIGS